MSRIVITKTILVLVVLAFTVLSGIQFASHRHYDVPVVAGPGVTKVGKLSDYCETLKGTRADTNVFFMEGEEEGGKALLIANTHSNEVAALLTSLIFIENGVPEKGSLIVIPFFNNSGSRNTKPGDGYPLFFDIPTPWGAKKFRMGNRNASPLDQWPDPDVYIHYPDRQLLSFLDVRNTNRTWPGRSDGLLMERVTFAAMELMRNEKVDVAIDIHGAETMFPVTNCIVAPDEARRIATIVSMTVTAMEGFENHVEPSPQGFRGLSHREIGDFSDTMPFLLEAPTPFLDQPTGPKTLDLLLTGQDQFLLSLSKQKKLFVPYDESGWTMARRVGQHCSVILEIFNQFSKRNEDRPIALKGVPRYAEVMEKGVGAFYADPSEVAADRVFPN
jgi:predicted deacylase